MGVGPTLWDAAVLSFYTFFVQFPWLAFKVKLRILGQKLQSDLGDERTPDFEVRPNRTCSVNFTEPFGRTVRPNLFPKYVLKVVIRIFSEKKSRNLIAVKNEKLICDQKIQAKNLGADLHFRA